MSARPTARAFVAGAALVTSLGLAVALAPAAAALSEPNLVTASTSTVRSSALVAPATVLPTLRYGSTGTYVSRVQRILAIKQTGTYNLATVAAVKRLQTWKKISPVNGVVSGATWTALSDATLSYTARTSRTARAAMPYLVWQASVHGRGIAYRESHLSCTAVSYNRSWRGKWQMTVSLWKANGGLTYAATPDKASCAAQDKVAHRIWVASWWNPWGG